MALDLATSESGTKIKVLGRALFLTFCLQLDVQVRRSQGILHDAGVGAEVCRDAFPDDEGAAPAVADVRVDEAVVRIIH